MMDETQVERLLGLLGSIAESLNRLAGGQDADAEPNWVWPLEEYATFDWPSHGAQVLARDTVGPTLVQFGGQTYKRRAPDNAFDPAIWFSRCVGKDADGRNEYVRLVTFRKFNEEDVQPLGRKAERYMASRPAPTQGAAVPATMPAAQPGTAPAPTATQTPIAKERPAPATSQAAPSEPPAWVQEAERDFAEMESASAQVSIPVSHPQPAGPRVSAGAAPDSAPSIIQQPRLAGGCPNCGQSIEHDNPQCANHRAPGLGRAAQANGTGRQAALDSGRVNAEFRAWAKDFAQQYKHYQIRATGDVDLYHVLMTVGSFGIAKITAENLVAVQEQLAAHAQAGGM